MPLNITMLWQRFTKLSPDEAIKPDPSSVSTLNNRGYARHLLGDHDGAISDSNLAIGLLGSNANYYHNRGAAYGATNDFGLAIADFEKALELDPDYRHAAEMCQSIDAWRTNLGQ